MNSISLFSGVGGLDLGLERSGIDTVAFVEQNKKCQSVLQYHWPKTCVFEDVIEFGKNKFAADVDIIHGGFPCQDVSYAGRRVGLEGSRSGLFWEFHRVLGEYKPQWFIIENVAGLLSSNRGKDMGAVLRSLVDIGYGVAYRVLDAQYFGVAQRRKRVFFVGYLGDWGPAAEVLAIQQGSVGDFTPLRRPRSENTGEIAACLNSGGNSGGFRTEPGEHLVPTMTPFVKTARAGAHPRTREQRPENWENLEIAPTLTSFDVGDVRATTLAMNQNLGVRRLTPVECERLQGFPDNWTLYAADNKIIADSYRYNMMGNAVCVNVAEWIGGRIANIHESINKNLV